MKTYRKVLDLKPTQFAVGMLEVDEKIQVVQGYNKKAREKFIDETEVPVVRAPNGELYVVDKHHFLAVCYHTGITEVRVKIVKNFKNKKLTYRQFWNWMRRSRNAYLFCQFGNGPHPEFYLPKDIRGVADDPYRSLAWFVRKSGAYENTTKNFAEFHWANFFRKKKLLDREGMVGFEKALKKAVSLAQTAEAKHLPGYIKLESKEQKLAEKKAVKKVKKHREGLLEHAVVVTSEKS